MNTLFFINISKLAV